MNIRYPERIVCLTEETTETLYLLGEQDRIVGISGFTVRPPQARKEKPKISAFTSAKIDAILGLKPDLVLGFSNLQADIARDLIKAGVEVYVFNHRTIAGILRMVATLGALVGETAKGQALAQSLAQRIGNVRQRAAQWPRKPRVYFEEWDEPMISGIGWVSELIEIAGGKDCFPELGMQPLAGNRIISDAQEVVRRQPDIIIGSWCGKKFRPEQVAARPGWNTIHAVCNGQIFEIKSPLILQPGPAALTDGLDALSAIIQGWRTTQH
jgi:iron complex transport system substrate-binding protein